MLINLFGNWINPQNIISVTSAENSNGVPVTKVVFANNAESNFNLEFADKNTTEVATEINNAISAGRKTAFADRGGSRGGGGDRGGFKRKFDDRGDRGSRGGDRGVERGGFKKKFDDKPERNSEEFKEKVRDDFKKKKFEGGRKFESKGRGDFKPKRRKDY
jgi:hypothetical protein